jgi:hypothetical protein
MTDNQLRMNQFESKARLDALETVLHSERMCGDFPSPRPHDANNHIHTFYSFSPYSPTLAVYQAYRTGLQVAGIVDHDSLSGAAEFKKAAKLAGIGSTSGVEMRVRFHNGFGTLNNPDQPDCMYMVAHGVCQNNIDAFNHYLAPFRAHREDRNRRMCDNLNQILMRAGIVLSYDKDVRPLSQACEGGSVTERHILYAVAIHLEQRFGRTQTLLDFLRTSMKLDLNSQQIGYLTDSENEWFRYDLLGVLKTNTRPYYIPADLEMPEAEAFVAKAKEFGAIPCYAYLGDVAESVTGDKRAQKFEDADLDRLIVELKKIAVPAITYMPTRNTKAQLARIRALCDQHGLLQISGEDINSPRQSFLCAAYADLEYRNLIDTTWALIEHEELSQEKGIAYGLFGQVNQSKTLSQKIEIYSRAGKARYGVNEHE